MAYGIPRASTSVFLQCGYKLDPRASAVMKCCHCGYRDTVKITEIESKLFAAQARMKNAQSSASQIRAGRYHNIHPHLEVRYGMLPSSPPRGCLAPADQPGRSWSIAIPHSPLPDSSPLKPFEWRISRSFGLELGDSTQNVGTVAILQAGYQPLNLIFRLVGERYLEDETWTLNTWRRRDPFNIALVMRVVISQPKRTEIHLVSSTMVSMYCSLFIPISLRLPPIALLPTQRAPSASARQARNAARPARAP